jgi:UDP-N-acetylglucosamine acyltransferase
MIGGYCVITQDVAPFSLTSTSRDPKVYGPNKVGLERHDFPPETIHRLHKAFRLLGSKELNTTQALERIRKEIPETPEVAELVDFIVNSERGVIK